MHDNAAIDRPKMTLPFLLLTLLCSGSPAIGQTSPLSSGNSHRRLELPEGGSSDIPRQMQMLRQLQTLLGNQTAENGTPRTPAIPPGQMEMIRQMMKNFSGQSPDDLMKHLNNLPPDVVSGVVGDPKARQQIEEMLKQFSKDRQFPQGQPRTGQPGLPPANTDTSPRDGNNGNNDNTTSPRTSGRSPTPQNSQAPGQPQPKNSTIDDLLKKLRDFENRHLSEQGRNAEQTATNSQKPQPGNNSTTPGRAQDTNSSPLPTEDDWAAKIEELIQRQRSQTSRTPAANNSTRPPGLRQRQPGRPQNNPTNQIAGQEPPESQTEPGTNGTPAAGGQQTITSVADFLKNFSDAQPEEKKNTQTSRSAKRTQQVATDAADTAAPIDQIQREVRSELAQKGFRETLRRIARDAKRQAEAARPSGTDSIGTTGRRTAGESGLSGAMAEAVTGITKDLVEIVKDAKFRSPQTSGRTPASGATGRTSARSSPSTLGRLRDSASDLISDVAMSANAAAEASSGPAGGGSIAEIGGSSLLPLAVLTALIAMGIALAWKFGLVGPEADGTGIGRTVAVKDIHSRADIIRAFHQMALTSDRNSQNWWTHQKVVDELVEQKPHRATQATALSSLYEQARYLPEDSEFTPEQIRDAKLALTQCEQ